MQIKFVELNCSFIIDIIMLFAMVQSVVDIVETEKLNGAMEMEMETKTKTHSNLGLEESSCISVRTAF
jgi:hypothetical protein